MGLNTYSIVDIMKKIAYTDTDRVEQRASTYPKNVHFYPLSSVFYLPHIHLLLPLLHHHHLPVRNKDTFSHNNQGSHHRPLPSPFYFSIHKSDNLDKSYSNLELNGNRLLLVFYSRNTILLVV